jgi:transketolase
MLKVKLIPVAEFRRIRSAAIDKQAKLGVIADMCRANTLASIKRAGSGHPGSSLSSLDIVTTLYYSIMNTAEVGLSHPDRDIYFSSKGHDAPGLYAVLYSLELLPKEKFVKLRRLGGTPGHPDIATPGIEANTGSLGMGISKARGIAHARRLFGSRGRIFVMTGDGELQEGQIYEALQAAAHQRTTNLHVIVDHNKVQSDRRVDEISGLGDLEAKFRAFGWHVARCDGHDFLQLENALASFQKIVDQPKLLIADTIKGKGVSFMEHPAALKANGGVYRWHSGAPDDESFEAAYKEIISGINQRLRKHELQELAVEEFPGCEKHLLANGFEGVAEAFGRTLVGLGKQRNDLIVLDADLSADCRLRNFEAQFPERFIENGIAEQDMVSVAGGLALHGMLPVVNSFGAFLSSRANEQIYNNCTEQKRIIYVCHYAGLLPAGPGHSHQSLRDISLLAALPNFVMLQPCNPEETRLALEYCVQRARESCMLRLLIGPSPGKISLPADYRLHYGEGVALTEGRDVIIFAYGPVMLHEAIRAAEILREKKISAKVVNMPWLNRVNVEWLQATLNGSRAVFVIDDHSPIGGLGDHLLSAMIYFRRPGDLIFRKLGVSGIPACGTATEALSYHRLDALSLAQRVREELHVPVFD